MVGYISPRVNFVHSVLQMQASDSVQTALDSMKLQSFFLRLPSTTFPFASKEISVWAVAYEIPENR